MELGPPSLLKESQSLSARRWQFSLRAALLYILGLSVILAVASQFPRLTAFTVAMAGLFLFPFVVLHLLLWPIVRLGIPNTPRSSPKSVVLNLLSQPFLVLSAPASDPSLLAGGIIATLSTVILVALWPLLRELGCALSLLATQPIANYTYSLKDAVRSFTGTLPSPEYWFRLGQWEMWAVARWWLLFGTITAAWTVLSFAVFGPNTKRARDALARLLSFAPWLIALEVAFLIGVWIDDPSVVPEPSTGFVVGIYSWDLWHWGCWLDRGWLIRGALPSFVAGTVFFTSVLRFPWTASMVASLVLIPIALLLSVACTVAYQNGFPAFTF